MTEGHFDISVGPGLAEENKQLRCRIRDLHHALSLALVRLIQLEPPDSAVSDEFVAMAAVNAGDDIVTDESRLIIAAALEKAIADESRLIIPAVAGYPGQRRARDGV